MIIIIILYLAFAGIGLYSPTFGTVWPIMHTSLGVSSDFGSFYAIFTTLGTVTAGLLNEKLVSRFSISKIAIGGFVVGATSMFATGMSTALWQVFIIAFFLGLGLSSLDIVLNHYLTIYFKPQVITWGHGSWGIGALISPIIASYHLKAGAWRATFVTIAAIQITLTFLLFLIRKNLDQPQDKPNIISSLSDPEDGKSSKTKPHHIPGFFTVVLTVFLYSGGQGIGSIWYSSFLVSRGFTPEKAAGFISVLFASMMISRLFIGFVAMKIGYKTILFTGQILMLVGIVCMIIPLDSTVLTTFAFIFVGMGAGPFFPGIMNLTVPRFGYKNAARIISLQMTASAIGSAILPQLVMFKSSESMMIVPILLLICQGGAFVANGFTNHITAKHQTVA